MVTLLVRFPWIVVGTLLLGCTSLAQDDTATQDAVASAGITFRLSSGGETYDFDLAGSAARAGARVGAWTVGADNRVRIVEDAGGERLFDVAWKMNGQNQLELSQGSTVAFNFHTSPVARPLLSLDHAVLVVKPDRNQRFAFRLQGDWSLTPDHLLQWKTGPETSTIDGFLNDASDGQFSYHFDNKARVTQGFDLAFTGRWTVPEGASTLHYSYDEEPSAAGEVTGDIELPPGLALDASINQLVYGYAKNNQSHTIRLPGLLQIGADYEVSYLVDEKATAGVRPSAIELVAEPVDAPDGHLALAVAGTGLASGTTVGGTFTPFAAATLKIGFSFSQPRTGGTTSSLVGFDADLRATASNTRVLWSVRRSGQAPKDVDITADVALGPATDGAPTIPSDSTGTVGIRSLFGQQR